MTGINSEKKSRNLNGLGSIVLEFMQTRVGGVVGVVVGGVVNLTFLYRIECLEVGRGVETKHFKFH